MTTVEAATQTARELLGVAGMEALRRDLEYHVRDAIQDAASHEKGLLAEAWGAISDETEERVVQDILSEVAG